MSIVPRAIAHSTIHPQHCRPREPLLKNPAPRNPGPRKQNRPTPRLLFHHALSPLSPERAPTQIKRGNILRRSGTEKTISWQLEIMPTLLRLVRKRNGTTKVTKGATIARRSAIFRGTFRNLQKTSVGLGNLCAGDWW